MRRSYTFMLVCASVYTSIFLKPTILRICSLHFSEILKSNKDQQRFKKIKSERSIFSRKILVFLLEVTQYEKHYNSLFSFANPISGKILIHKFWPKMLSSNQVTGFLIISFSGSNASVLER